MKENTCRGHFFPPLLARLVHPDTAGRGTARPPPLHPGAKAAGSGHLLRSPPRDITYTPPLPGLPPTHRPYTDRTSLTHHYEIRSCEMLFGIGLRSKPRNRELRVTTESCLDMDGTPRRQPRARLFHKKKDFSQRDQIHTKRRINACSFSKTLPPRAV